MVAVYDVYDRVREGDDLKKVIRVFGEEESAPPRENPGYAYGGARYRTDCVDLT